MMEHIMLIGFMGSGKSAVGRELSRLLKRPLVDTDEEIVKAHGTITDLFAKHGEAYFRKLETETLKTLLDSKKPLVISAGGGLPVQEANQPYLRQLGTVVYLTASEDTLVKRLSGDKSRPLLQGGDLRTRIRDLMAQRGALYARAADVQVSTDGRSVKEIAGEISRLAK